MKKGLIFLALCAVLLLSACGGTASAPAEAPSADGRVRIELRDGGSTGAVRIAGDVVTISSGGMYTVAGTLTNGQLVIDTGEDAKDVYLELNGVTLTNLGGPALLVQQAKNVYLSTAAGTKNLLVSGTEEDLARFDGTQNGAVIFSEDDLKLSGEGELELRGYINNGITCKDDLDVESGTLVVYAASNGLRGSESVEIKGGSVTVSAGNDGVKSTSAAKAGKGFVTVSGGSLDIAANGDGISAETVFTMSGGTVLIQARGDGLAQSSKGVKAVTGLEIADGALTVSAICDAVSCDGDVTVSGGLLRITTDGDGIQAGKKNSGIGVLTVSGGDLLVSAGKRALHAQDTLTVTGGTVLGFSLKQAAPSGGSPFVLEGVNGEAGTEALLNERALGTAEHAFTTLLYVGPELSSGETLSLSCGARTLRTTVR